MQIKIDGSKCVTCKQYNQYYTVNNGAFEAIDCGYCYQKQCRTRPWNRCKEYREKSNIMQFAREVKEG